MSVSINPITIDETLGVQATDLVSTDWDNYDFMGSSAPIEVATTGFDFTNVVDATVTDLNFSLVGSADAPAVSYVDTLLKTLDGETIYLVLEDGKIACGYTGTVTGGMLTTDRLVFEIQIDVSGATIDAATNGIVLALYEPIQHIEGITEGLNGDDVLSLAMNSLYLVSTEEPDGGPVLTTYEFSSFSSAPSGQNYWLAFASSKDFYIDADTQATASLLVTGKTSGVDTVNTSTIGIGTNSQAVDKGEGVNFQFVTGVNLAGNTKDPSGTGAYSWIDAESFSFKLVQVQGSSKSSVSVGITAVDVDTADGETPSISTVTVSYGGNSYAFSASGSQGGVTATFNADGSIVLSGLKAQYTVTVDGEGLNDIRVTNENSKWGFDLGAFSFSAGSYEPGVPTDEYTEIASHISFVDDEPSFDGSAADASSAYDWKASGLATSDGVELQDVSLGASFGADGASTTAASFEGYKISLNASNGLTDFSSEVSADGHTLTFYKGSGETRVDYIEVDLASDGTYSVDLLQEMPTTYQKSDPLNMSFTTASGPSETLTSQSIVFDGLIFGSSNNLTQLLGDKTLGQLSAYDLGDGVAADDLNPNSRGFGVKSGQASQFNQNEGFMVTGGAAELGSLTFGIEWVSGGVKTMTFEYWIVDGDTVTHDYAVLTKASDISYTIDCPDGADEIYVRTAFDKASAGVRLVDFSVTTLEATYPTDLDFSFDVLLTDADGDTASLVGVNVDLGAQVV